MTPVTGTRIADQQYGLCRSVLLVLIEIEPAAQHKATCRKFARGDADRIVPHAALPARLAKGAAPDFLMNDVGHFSPA